MKARPDLLDDQTPAGWKVFQLTDEPGIPWCHVYMEAQVFTPDSRFLVLHRSAKPHGRDRLDPEHRYVLCDLDSGDLAPLTDEVGATSPAVSPDGRWLYYFVDETRLNAGRLTLKRVGLDGRTRETLLVLDRPPEGADTCISRVYPLSTLSSDGRRLALSGFFGDGSREDADSGLLVFDLDRATASVVLRGPTWINMHPQYCRSIEPGESHDLLIQENHGCRTAPDGRPVTSVAGAGVDLHLIRDDGADFRDIPVGRDGVEYCQGHQCWRGRSAWTITGTGIANPRQKHGWGQELIEALPAPHAGHLGRATPAAIRNDLSRSFEIPDFRHFQTDREGRLLLSDCGPFDEGGRLFLARLGEPGRDPVASWKPLLRLRCSNISDAHAHPFLAPDGRRGFFNSDESGTLQAYMIEGW
jgi:hypothetical protein